MKTAPCCQLLEGQLESLLSLSGCRHIACHREGNKFTRTASPSVTNRDTAETKGQAPSQSWGLISPRAGARRRRAARGLARTEVPPHPSPGTHRAASFCEPKGRALSFEMSVFTSKTSCRSLQTLLMGLTHGAVTSRHEVFQGAGHTRGIFLHAWLGPFGLLAGENRRIRLEGHLFGARWLVPCIIEV